MKLKVLVLGFTLILSVFAFADSSTEGSDPATTDQNNSEPGQVTPL